ncbi:MAG: MogA/MoaB family molybdenum cofactor biosynthesis protein [Candidatus Lambdaproteobacteria bacterium]|nr:MogA/MoaB family molybdenum cofactor biosynthesis protein [Candidatus Lambdaproteobacteria bacterium]
MAVPSHQEHKEKAARGIACAVITVSDTRTPETDSSGQLIRTLLQEQGHAIAAYQIVRDEPTEIRPLIARLLGQDAVQALIINGGTGVARRDVTFDVVQAMLEKTLPGFGELFRQLSYAEIGSAAMLSRATAGICQGKAVFSMPGSSGAVRLAMERLILPELPHIVFELHK